MGESRGLGTSVTRTGIAPVLAARRDRLKQLRLFCETVRLGSLSRAAEHLGTSQPSVSNAVRTLEEEMGVALFERRGPRVALTRVGEQLYESALPVVVGVLRLPLLFAEAHHGEAPEWLRIGAGSVSASRLLPDPLRRFRARYPGVRIELRAGPGQKRLDWLRRFEVDAAVGVVDPGAPDVEFRPLYVSTMVLITPRNHPLAARGAVEPAELTRHAFVAPGEGQHARRLQDALLHVHGASPRVLVEVDGWRAILAHVAAGAGIGFVPDLCMTGGETVACVPVNAPPIRRIYGIALRRDGPVSLAARQFAEMAASDTAR